jgi:hypothetical protein
VKPKTKTLQIGCGGDQRHDIILEPSREAQIGILNAINALFISPQLRDGFKDKFQAATDKDFDSWLLDALAHPSMTLHTIFSVRGTCCPDVDGTTITWTFDTLKPFQVSLAGILDLQIYSDAIAWIQPPFHPGKQTNASNENEFSSCIGTWY